MQKIAWGYINKHTTAVCMCMGVCVQLGIDFSNIIIHMREEIYLSFTGINL